MISLEHFDALVALDSERSGVSDSYADIPFLNAGFVERDITKVLDAWCKKKIFFSVSGNSCITHGREGRMSRIEGSLSSLSITGLSLLKHDDEDITYVEYVRLARQNCPY